MNMNNFEITPAILKSIQTIERVKENIRLAILPPAISEQLRWVAQIRQTHYSTAIEGNRLTLEETEEVLKKGKTFYGRTKDVREVANYYKGLQLMEKWVNAQQPITEKKCQMLHSALFYGKANQASPYRDGQNVIKDSNGTIVYLPPEAQDVPRLMQELFSWITSSSEHFPIPIIAAVAHYQFETIHPYFDGNGRTGRMLTTWILFQGGYDLGRFYALEEFYANDLTGYYDALVTHPHHNYYFGRNTAPITNWIEYFLNGMAHVFDEVEQQVRARIHRETNPEILQALRELNVQQRKVLTLFITQKNVTVKDIANILSLAERYTRDLVNEWVVSGFLFQTDLDGRKRNRHYGLLPTYQILLEQDL